MHVLFLPSRDKKKIFCDLACVLWSNIPLDFTAGLPPMKPMTFFFCAFYLFAQIIHCEGDCQGCPLQNSLSSYLSIAWNQGPQSIAQFDGFCAVLWGLLLASLQQPNVAAAGPGNWSIHPTHGANILFWDVKELSFARMSRFALMLPRLPAGKGSLA